MKINQVRQISREKHVNLYSADYTDQKGCEKKWVFASRSNRSNPFEADRESPDAVVIVPFHISEKKLVLIREFRVTLNGYQYGFPAGLLDPGETVETAGKRELFEETGLAVTRILKKSPAVFSSSGLTDESVSLVFVECDGSPSSRFTEASEDIEVVMLSQHEAKHLLGRNGLQYDVKTWIVLNGFADQGMI